MMNIEFDAWLMLLIWGIAVSLYLCVLGLYELFRKK